YDGSLYSLNNQGAVQWKFDAGGARSVSVKGTTLYLPSTSGEVFAIDSSTSKVLWKFQLDRGVPTEVLITDQYAIFGSSYQYIYALELATGELKYRFNLGSGSGVSAPPAYFPELKQAYFLSMSGNLYQFKIRGDAEASEFDHYLTTPRSEPGVNQKSAQR
ncbi:MAG: hypothetical protein EOP09_09700, partial [Proteobacteria bacterium]